MKGTMTAPGGAHAPRIPLKGTMTALRRLGPLWARCLARQAPSYNHSNRQRPVSWWPQPPPGAVIVPFMGIQPPAISHAPHPPRSSFTTAPQRVTPPSLGAGPGSGPSPSPHKHSGVGHRPPRQENQTTRDSRGHYFCSSASFAFCTASSSSFFGSAFGSPMMAVQASWMNVRVSCVPFTEVSGRPYC